MIVSLRSLKIKNMWQTIIGHENQKEQLRRAIAGGNVPHAYLFSGIDGIGKRFTAHAAAAALFCNQPNKDVTPCGKCESCRKLASKTHPDLVELAPENNQITIDLIREIKNQLKFPPLIGGRRIIIIDQAELMNPNAANAALKILEEPPSGNHFFLITCAPHLLLPTIISRCQKMQFSPLTNGEIENYLTSHHRYSAEQARMAAGTGAGSIGRALSMTPELIGSVTQEFTQLLRSGAASGVLELSAKWASEKSNIENILYILHRCFHNALLASEIGTSPSPQSSPPHPTLSPRGEGISHQPPRGEGVSYQPAGGEGDQCSLAGLIRSKNGPIRLAEKCDLINKAHSYTTRTYNKQLMFEQLLFSLVT